MDIKKLVALCAVSVLLSACGGGDCDCSKWQPNNGGNNGNAGNNGGNNGNAGNNGGNAGNNGGNAGNNGGNAGNNGGNAGNNGGNAGNNGGNAGEQPAPPPPPPEPPKIQYRDPDPKLVAKIDAITTIKANSIKYYYRGMKEKKGPDAYAAKVLKEVKPSVLPKYKSVMLKIEGTRGSQFLTTGMYSAILSSNYENDHVWNQAAVFMKIGKIRGLWTEPGSAHDKLSGIMHYKGENSVIGAVVNPETLNDMPIFGDIEATVHLTKDDKSFEGKITNIKHLGSTVMEIDPGSHHRKAVQLGQNFDGKPIAIDDIGEIVLEKTQLQAQNDPKFEINNTFLAKGFRGVGVMNGKAVAKKAETEEVLNDKLRYSVTLAGPGAEDVVGYVAVPVHTRTQYEPVLPFVAGRIK